MLPINFKSRNQILGTAPGTKESPMQLPVWTDGKVCLSCWRPTFWERVQILLLGRVWVGCLSGRVQPALFLRAGRSVKIFGRDGARTVE